MDRERGIALILALLFLSFLSILGGALLATSTIDVWISDNYKTAVQNHYLAEAGIEQAQEVVRASTNTPTQLLTAAAGADQSLSVSRDLDALLASDDQPLIPAAASMRSGGQPLSDKSGRIIGHYHVWLRNDYADEMGALTDSNQVLTLLGFGRIGSARKVIEVTIKKTSFPPLPAALTLDGPVAEFNLFNPAPDTTNMDTDMDPMLRTVDGLERIAASISANASDIYNPPFGSAEAIRDYGSPGNYRIAVVNGDVELGPGIGYGMLIVRGNVTVAGNFTWNGLILILGQGVLHWNQGFGSVNGGVFIARTRSNDRTITNLLGTQLATRGAITADFNGAAGSGIIYDSAKILAANGPLPYSPIAIRER